MTAEENDVMVRLWRKLYPGKEWPGGARAMALMGWEVEVLRDSLARLRDSLREAADDINMTLDGIERADLTRIT